MPSEREMLEELREFDTPSITNVVATYPGNPLCLGLYNPWTENWYTDQTIRCMYPEMGRRVGHAVTCVYGLPDPAYPELTFMDVVDALAGMRAVLLDNKARLLSLLVKIRERYLILLECNDFIIQRLGLES